MASELFFRVAFSTFWIILFVSLVWVRYLSRHYSGKHLVARTGRHEQLLAILALALLAPLWFAGILFYAILPDWISFLSIPLPDWFRLFMVVADLLTITFTLWGYRTLGKGWVHILEPSGFQQGEYNTLVTTGPYHYVRNPIYLGVFSLFVAQALVAANWLLLLPSLAIITVFYMQIGGEETMLRERFGEKYLEYMRLTPRIIPRFRQRAGTKEPSRR